MGTSKRYVDAIDQRMNESVVEVVMRGTQPDTLTQAELQLDTEPLTRTPVARPVRAWVRYGDVGVQVDGEAVAWTERAVAIRWRTPAGELHRAWVWASAVQPR